MVKLIFKSLNLHYQKIKYYLGFTQTYILKRNYYTSRDILEKEYQNLFDNYWIFAGLTLEIKDNKSWVKKKIGKREIIITHENGKYFALENVCPHKKYATL